MENQLEKTDTGVTGKRVGRKKDVQDDGKNLERMEGDCERDLRNVYKLRGRSERVFFVKLRGERPAGVGKDECDPSVE